MSMTRPPVMLVDPQGPTVGVENTVATIASFVKDTDRTIDQDERAEVPRFDVARRHQSQLVIIQSEERNHFRSYWCRRRKSRCPW